MHPHGSAPVNGRSNTPATYRARGPGLMDSPGNQPGNRPGLPPLRRHAPRHSASASRVPDPLLPRSAARAAPPGPDQRRRRLDVPAGRTRGRMPRQRAAGDPPKWTHRAGPASMCPSKRTDSRSKPSVSGCRIMKPDGSGTSSDTPSDPPPPKQEEPPEVPFPDSIPVDEPNVDPQQPPTAPPKAPPDPIVA
jgi:hypothetical protein